MRDGRLTIDCCSVAGTVLFVLVCGAYNSLRPPRRLARVFRDPVPVLSDIETEFAWEGLFAMTPDSLPYIGPHRHYPRQWFALGYGGNGMTFGFLAARVLVERWQGQVTRDHAFFEFGRVR